jgi:hypothetical protein
MEGFSERLWYALARLTTSLHIGPVLTNLTFKRQPGYARTHVHSNCKSSWSWYSPIEFRGENAFSEAPVWLVSCVSVPLHHAPADYAHKRFPALRNKRSDNGEKMRGALTPTYVVTENVKFYALVLDASESWGSIGVLGKHRSLGRVLEKHKAGDVSLYDPYRTGYQFTMPSHLSVLAAIGGLLTFGHAQVSSNTTASAMSTSTYSQSDVPTGTPLPGDYDEPLRPQVHYSPPVGFMSKFPKTQELRDHC